MSTKISRIVYLIKRLSIEELAELNARLKDLSPPPLEYVGKPAKPKPTPPTLTDAIEVEKK